MTSSIKQAAARRDFKPQQYRAADIFSLSSTPLMSASNLGFISSISHTSGIAEVKPQDMDASLDDSDSAFVSKLPNELLYKIFQANSEKYLLLENGLAYAHAALNDATDNGQHARAAGQVCRRWREVALAASGIWSRLLDTYAMPPLWFEEVLRRSGSALLTVVSVHTRGPSDDPYSEDNIQLLLQPDVLNRLEVFHVESYDPEIMYAIKEFPFPLLRRCSLVFPVSDISGRPYGSIQLFGDRAPFLQQLQIAGITLRASYTFYSTLTSLHIYEESLSPILILRILQQTPMLQDLSLRQNDTNADPAPQPQYSELNDLDISSIPVIHLSHIKRLRIYHKLTTSFLEVVSRLRLKSIKSLFISILEAFPGELYDTLMASISKILPQWPSMAPESIPDLRFAAMSPYLLKLDIGPKDITVQQTHASHLHIMPGASEFFTNLSIELRDLAENPADREDIAKMLRPLWARFASTFSNCELLTVRCRDGDYAFDEQDWRSMLTCFGSLLKFNLHRVKFLEDLLRTLSLPLVENTPVAPVSDSDSTPKPDEDVATKSTLANPSKLLLPSLQYLSFPQIAINDNSTFATFTKLLAFRQDQNSQIRRMVLTDLPAMLGQSASTEVNAVGHRCAEVFKLCVERVQSLVDFGFMIVTSLAE